MKKERDCLVVRQMLVRWVKQGGREGGRLETREREKEIVKVVDE